MGLLLLLNSIVFVAIVYTIYTQIYSPYKAGIKIFPMFRITEKKKEVEALKEQVHNLREEVVVLEELNELSKEKQALESQTTKQ